MTIVRDDWGIAHVHGKTDAEAVFGMIYAQAEDDFFRVETNFITTLGAGLQAVGILCLALNLLRSWKKGKVAGDDPWDAWTLEWATSSPPPEYNFETAPAVRSRRPLWDLKHPDDPDWKYE